MLRKIYLSPIGVFISILLNILRLPFKPFMVYGYWDFTRRKFLKHVRVSSTALIMKKENVVFSDYVWVGHYNIIDGSYSVEIGEGVQLSAWVGIFTHGSHDALRLHGRNYIHVPSEQRLGYAKGAVKIGEYSFIGAGSIVLPGVIIGKGCVVSANSVVTKSVPDYSIVSGAPGKVVGDTRDIDKKHINNPSIQASYYAPENFN